MKKTLRHVFTFLLVLAMILPMVGGAWAAKEFTLTNKEKLYVRNNEDGKYQGSVKITAKNFSGGIEWEVTKGNDVLDRKKDVLGKDSITLFAELPEKGTDVEETLVTVQATAGGKTTSTSFMVAPDTVETISLSLDDSSIEVGGDTKANVTAKYASGDKAEKIIKYSSSDNTVATVNEDGKIKAKKVGKTTITATAGEKSASKPLTVTAVSLDFTASTGQPFSLRKLSIALAARFGVEFDDKDTVTFTGISANASGALKLDGKEIANKDTCKFKELSDVEFTSDKDEDFTFTVTVVHKSLSYSADVTIECELAEIDIPISIPTSADDSYSFSDKSADGRTAAKIIADAFADVEDFLTSGSLVFGKGNTTSNKKIGALSDETGKDVSYSAVNAEDLDKLQFQINTSNTKSGTYEISFTAYDKQNGKGNKIAEGTLSITVNAASLNTEIELSGTEPYEFSSKIDGNVSAKTLLTEAINDVVGKNQWGGLRFAIDKLSKTSIDVGTLYKDSGSTTNKTNEVDEDDYIDSTKLGSLYFVPDGTGTYEVGFSVYKDEDAETALAFGTLTISVSADLSKVNIRWITTVGKTIQLEEVPFGNFIQDVYGTRYSLVYITLDDVDGGGTFYHNGTKFTPGTKSDKYYADIDDAPSKAKFIEDITFTAPNKPGITYVNFTAYAEKKNSTDLVEEKGVFCIFYGYADVPTVTVRVSTDPNSLTMLAYGQLQESQFLEAYRSATGSTAAKPQFSICFTELPPLGLLYKNYNADRGTGTEMKADDLGTTYFTIGSGSSKSVSTVCYIAAASQSVSDSAAYIAFDSNGNPLYVGKIHFVSNTPKKVTVNSEGLDFSAKDFSDYSDPIDYVTFAEPASGKLYVTDGKATDPLLAPVTKTTKFWIDGGDPTKGTYAISKLHYIPRAGQTEDVTLTYTVHTSSGSSYDGTIIVSTVTKTASDKFPDVPSDVAKWAADAIDFANKYKMVQGDQNGNFMPRNNMRRCDLILIFYRMAGSPVVTGALPYTDVGDGGSSYAKEIYNSALWASQNGIVDGIVTGTEYKPKESVKREEYIRILYNYAKYTGASVKNKGKLDGFTDAAEVSDFAVEAMKWALDKGYTVGTGNNKLSPKDETNRAQIVTFLYRYLSY